MLDFIAFSFSLMLTDHLGVCLTCNEVHPRIEIVSEISDRWDAAAGVFYNSKRRVSPFFGVRWNGNPVFAELGVVGGYVEHQAAPFGRLGVNLSEDYSAFIFPILHAEELRLGIGFEIRF